MHLRHRRDGVDPKAAAKVGDAGFFPESVLLHAIVMLIEMRYLSCRNESGYHTVEVLWKVRGSFSKRIRIAVDRRRRITRLKGFGVGDLLK